MERPIPQTPDLPRIPKQLLDAVRKKSCILWAGAGFSLEASFTDGARLLNSRDLAYHLARKTYKELEREREPTRNEHVDLKMEAAKFEEAFKRRELVLELFRIFGKEGLMTGEAHQLAIKLFPIIFTTNYDSLFERAAYSQNKEPLIVRGDYQIPFIEEDERPTVVKLHGDLNDPNQIVITAKDYDQKRFSQLLISFLVGLFLNRVFLFVGYTLDDEDFRDAYLKRVLALLPDGFAPRGFLVAQFLSEDPEESTRWEVR